MPSERKHLCGQTMPENSLERLCVMEGSESDVGIGLE